MAVDVTAETAADARRRALDEGQVRALRQVLERLTRRADHAALPVVEPGSTGDLVRGIEIANEKTSSVRYLADLTVQFKPGEIRRLLRQTGLPFAETASRPVVVLPVLKTAGGLFLWDAANQWRTAWSALPLRSGLVPIVVPLGDLADIADIDAAQAMLGDPAAIEAIATRYGAGDALVALATLSATGYGLSFFEVVATRPSEADAATILFSLTSPSDDDVDEMMMVAASETVARVEAAWLDAHLLTFESMQTIALVVPVNGLGQWASVRRRLSEVSEISTIALKVLRRDSAQVELTYFGEESRLAAALGRRDLDLEPALSTEYTTTTHGAVEISSPVAQPQPMRVLRPRDG
ncbi:MAG: DUF2066 domain-containing protein [Alphaproteobacteria bacterium]